MAWSMVLRALWAFKTPPKKRDIRRRMRKKQLEVFLNSHGFQDVHRPRSPKRDLVPGSLLRIISNRLLGRA